MISAPWETLAFSLLLLCAPAVAASQTQRPPLWQVASLVATIIVTLFVDDGRFAYAAAAGTALLHGVSAWPKTRTGSVALGVSATLLLGVSAAIGVNQITAAFLLSIVAVAMRTGAMPFHAGMVSLCDRAPLVQTQQLASTIALVFIHLRFVDHHNEAIALAPTIVRFGAGAAFAAALMSTVQRDLHGFFRSTTAVHGGMIVAALGAASLHNYAAALLVTVSAGLGLGGLGIMIESLEERVGTVSYARSSGRVQAFPRLAAAFALFGAASVAMPGTVGFIADDLLLHALWMESPTGTVLVILSSAMLAVSTLICYAFVFLGRPASLLAPDLVPRERVVAALLVVLLLALGFAPSVLLYPADEFLERPPNVAEPAARVAARPVESSVPLNPYRRVPIQ